LLQAEGGSESAETSADDDGGLTGERSFHG
jgi:hypothetical protein